MISASPIRQASWCKTNNLDAFRTFPCLDLPPHLNCIATPLHLRIHMTCTRLDPCIIWHIHRILGHTVRHLLHSQHPNRQRLHLAQNNWRHNHQRSSSCKMHNRYALSSLDLLLHSNCTVTPFHCIHMICMRHVPYTIWHIHRNCRNSVHLSLSIHEFDFLAYPKLKCLEVHIPSTMR